MLRVSTAVRDRAAALAAQEGVTLGDLVGRALEAYENEVFWRRTRAALLADPEPDDDLWESTLSDGLDDD